MEKAGSDGTLTWNGTNNNPEYVELFSRIIDSKNPEEYADAAYDSQHYLADQMVAISLGVESMFYPYNIETLLIGRSVAEMEHFLMILGSR